MHLLVVAITCMVFHELETNEVKTNEHEVAKGKDDHYYYI